VSDLAALLVSDEYMPCKSLKYEFSGHDLIAFSAMQAIESIGVPPDIETLRTLLADRRVFELPEASYDQGAYIGDPRIAASNCEIWAVAAKPAF
jgi:hypothetical protein